MSILAYTGLPGSGKSYNAVANVIVPAFKAGRRVVTNIPLVQSVVDQEGFGAQYVPISSDELSDKLNAVVGENHGSVFVLDELWRLWPAGMTQQRMPPGHAQWLAEHRHHTGADGLTDEIVLVTQDLSQVASPVRALIESTYIHRKLTALGSSKSFKVNVFQGSQTGAGRESQKLNGLTGKYKPEIFRWYRSHTHSETGAGLEQAADGRASLWKSPKVIALIVFGTVAPAVALYVLAGVLSDLAGGEDASTGAAAQSVAVAQPRPSYASELEHDVLPARLLESDAWRVTGYVQSSRGLVVFLENGETGRTRTMRKDCVWHEGEPVCDLHGAVVASYTGKVRPEPGLLERSVRGYGDSMIAGR